jgi:hypothetical protein
MRWRWTGRLWNSWRRQSQATSDAATVIEFKY